MNDDDRPPRLRRILAAVDASPLSLAGLRLAARLAQRSGARLTALYVEDLDLLRAAAYPSAYVYSLVTARQRPLEAAVIEQALRFQATVARRALEETAAAFSLQARLETRRGPVAREMLAAAAEADLLVLGWSGRPGAPGQPRLRLGTTARKVLRACARPVLLSRHEPTPEAGVLAVVTPDAAGHAALDLAARLAPPEAPLEVAVLGDESEPNVAALAREAGARTAAHAGGGKVAVVPADRRDRLARRLRERHAGLVVTTPALSQGLETVGGALAVAPQLV